MGESGKVTAVLVQKASRSLSFTIYIAHLTHTAPQADQLQANALQLGGDVILFLYRCFFRFAQLSHYTVERVGCDT